jgi:hypothetical protein
MRLNEINVIGQLAQLAVTHRQEAVSVAKSRAWQVVV